MRVLSLFWQFFSSTSLLYWFFYLVPYSFINLFHLELILFLYVILLILYLTPFIHILFLLLILIFISLWSIMAQPRGSTPVSKLNLGLKNFSRGIIDSSEVEFFLSVFSWLWYFLYSWPKHLFLSCLWVLLSKKGILHGLNDFIICM